MKSFIFTVIVLAFSTSYATEESRFKLLTSKCEFEANNSLDTSPQSPPLNIDDPATPGCNKWEINFTVNADVTQTEKNWQLPLLDINYGIGDNLQLKYEIPLEKNQTEGSTESKVGNSKVGLKYLFFEDEESHLDIGFYPQVEFVKADGNNSDSKSSTVTTLPLLISKKLSETPNGDIMLATNIGYSKSSDKNIADMASLATGVGMPLFSKVSIMAELSTEQAMTNREDIREQIIIANFGAMTSITKNIFLYGSLGKSLYASDEKDHTYFLTGIRVLAGGF